MDRPHRILIVDDEPNVRLMFRTALATTGAEIALAEDRPFVVAGDDLRVSSKALAKLIKAEAPAVVADLDDERETTSTQSMETHDLTLSLEYSFVQIRRDEWWNDAILRMPHWYAPGQKAGEFAS